MYRYPISNHWRCFKVTDSRYCRRAEDWCAPENLLRTTTRGTEVINYPSVPVSREGHAYGISWSCILSQASGPRSNDRSWCYCGRRENQSHQTRSSTSMYVFHLIRYNMTTLIKKIPEFHVRSIGFKCSVGLARLTLTRIRRYTM